MINARRRRMPMLKAAFATITLSLAAWTAGGEAAGENMNVDAAVVLAVDASSSIDIEQARLQREGHADALRSVEVKTAIAAGFIGCIAVIYVEWSGVGVLHTVLPWTRLCDGSDADRAAATIARSSGSERRGGRTSLSFALDAGSLLLDGFPGSAARKIIDVSSNGTNNDGLAVTESRDRALQKGYTINGIVLAAEEPGVTPDLPGYFRRNVAGGARSFVVVPDGPAAYAASLRQKLILEISKLDPGDAGRPAERSLWR